MDRLAHNISRGVAGLVEQNGTSGGERKAHAYDKRCSHQSSTISEALLQARSLSYDGTLPLGADADRAFLLARIADALRSADATSVEMQSDRISFKAGAFRFVNNWNVLVPFGSGEVIADVEHHVLRYRLCFRQMVVVATVLMCPMAAFMVFSKASEMLVAIPFMLLWLVGGNLAIGLPRFQAFLRKALAGDRV